MTAAAHSAIPISFSQIPPGSAWWLYAIVIAALALHIGGGSIAILSGFGAVSVKKGARLHILFGKIFVVAMLVMGSVGALLSIPIHQRGNIAGGVLAVYLVLSGWMTIKRPAGTVGAMEKAIALIPLAVGALFLLWGMQATANGGSLDGNASPLYYNLAGVAALLAVLDFKLIWQGGISGVSRIARHVWRMCFALFFAAGSFFLGQQKVMPKFMHGSPILWVLALAPLGIMIFWLIRIRRGNRFRPRPALA